MPNITIDENIVAKAIFDSLTKENRDEILKETIQHLLTKKQEGQGYYSTREKKTIIQDAFENAARAVANQIIKEQLQTDPFFRTEIEKIIVDGFRKFVEDEERRDSLVETISRAFVAMFDKAWKSEY